MSWSKRKSRRLATRTSIILGFIAGITINLLTSWFQQDIPSNARLLIFVVIILLGIGGWFIKIRAPLMISAFVILVFSIAFNLFSSWIQENILHNIFTTLNITWILSFTIMIL